MYYDPYTGQFRPLPGTAVPGATVPGATSYYYCYSPLGYYPDVQQCPSGWVAIPPG